MVFNQVLRSIRVWAPRLAAPLAELEQGKAQLGLAHSYSRAKVKFNVNRVDNMIIQVPNIPESCCNGVHRTGTACCPLPFPAEAPTSADSSRDRSDSA